MKVDWTKNVGKEIIISTQNVKFSLIICSIRESIHFLIADIKREEFKRCFREKSKTNISEISKYYRKISRFLLN